MAVALDLLGQLASCCTSTIMSVRPPWIVRSNIILVIATIQPWFFWPTRLAFGTMHVLEKNLVEAALAGHLDQRPDGHARAFHVDQEVAQALVLGQRGSVRHSKVLKSA